MIWHGYFDESDKDDWFVIAGYMATVPQWAAFSAEWAPMARKYGRIDRDGRRHFHMSERSRADDGREDLPAIRNIIADHVLMGLAVALRPSEFRKAVRRLVACTGTATLPVTGELAENHLLYVFDAFLDSISDKIVKRVPHLDKIDPENDRIELIFDERAEKRIVRNAWDDFKQSRRENNVPSLINAEPRFEDDKEFMPLQAADFLAYWLRERLSKLDDPAQITDGPLFPFRRSKKHLLHNVVVLDEEEIVRRFESAVTKDGARIIDIRKTVIARK